MIDLLRGIFGKNQTSKADGVEFFTPEPQGELSGVPKIRIKSGSLRTIEVKENGKKKEKIVEISGGKNG